MKGRFRRGILFALTGVVTLSAGEPAMYVKAEERGLSAEIQSEVTQFMDCFLPMPIMDPKGLSTDCWGAAEVGPRDPYNGLEDDDMSDYSYWDGGIIKDDTSGKYYMFASRWDQRGGHEGEGEYPGWKRSEAIYAVSDNLYGPYEDKGLLWPDYHEGAGHNVYPFVLSESDPLYGEGYRYGIVLGDPWDVQGTIHVSKTLENGGDWTHLEQMNCDGNFTMTNISIIVRPDGRYEAISRNGDIATADSVNGPWHVERNGLWWDLQGLDTTENDMEDPVIWYSDGLYHCLVNKWNAKQAYYMTSFDGITNWTLHEGAAYTPYQNFLSYEDGTENNWTKLERPNAYIENGELKAMLLSVINVEKTADRPNDQNGSKIIVTPFDGAALRDLVDSRYTGVLPEGDANVQTWQQERYHNYGGQPYFQVQKVSGVEGIGESGESGWWWPDWEYDCKIGFLKYDLSQFEPDNTEKEIESAYLSLNYLGKKSGTSETDSIRIVLSDPNWQEGTGKDEDTSETDLAGLNFPKLHYDNADLETSSVVSEEFATNEGLKTVRADVTKLVKEFKETYPEEESISFALNETESGNRLQFGSKEAGDGYGARLIINYKEEREVQDGSLKLAVAMAEKLELEQAENQCYTEETWAAVQTALDEARALLGNAQITQEEVDTSFLKLMTSCNLLESNAQRLGLKATIEGAEAVLADSGALAQYTEESVQAVRDTLAEAKNVYALSSADQASINAAATNLMNAVNNLLIKEKESRLDILIQKAEELLKNKDGYTDASVTVLETALEAAKVIAANPQAAPESVDQAYNDLAEAITNLVRKADKSELENAIGKADAILANPTAYVTESIAGLAAATEKARLVYDDQAADSSAVGEAVKELLAEILKARLLGDVNLDGTVDTADSAEVLRYAAEYTDLTEEQHRAADVNKDRVSDSSDAARILQYSAEKITTFQ